MHILIRMLFNLTRQPIKTTMNLAKPAQPIESTKAANQLWYLLSILSFYRLVTALGLLASSPTLTKFGILGSHMPQLYTGAAAGYAIIAVFWIFTSRFFKQAFLPQVYFQFFTDLLFLTALMHASGGAQSGVAFLLVVSIIVNGLLVSQLTTYFFAALSALSILASAIYSSLSQVPVDNALTASGVMGIVFFCIAFLVNFLNHRTQENERLAIQQHAEIGQLEKLNELIVEQSQNGVLVVNEARRVLLINQRATELLTNHYRDPEESPLLIGYSSALDAALTQWQLNSNSESVNLSNLSSANHLGKSYDTQASFLTLKQSKGSVLITLTDVSSVAKALQNQKLASLGRLTASVAHEIRNPLSAINQAAQLIEELDSLTEKDIRLIHIITQQVTRMDNMVESILQLSKRGKVRPTTFELNAWLRQFAQEFCFEQSISEHCIKIKPSDATLIECDKGHLQQIMQNICANSVKYGKNQDGECKITLWLEQGIHHGQSVALCISDEGNGVPKDKQAHIFEPFHTSSSDTPGLGLYICDELARLNGIELSYQPAIYASQATKQTQAHHFRLECAVHSKNI